MDSVVSASSLLRGSGPASIHQQVVDSGQLPVVQLGRLANSIQCLLLVVVVVGFGHGLEIRPSELPA